ncbi:MAG: hypothetical protein JWR80_4139 [Bradyrhizobium sp.]|nr:hypothetical protein [Bradyrhizobium sp.]
MSFFGFGRWDVADGLKQPALVEPVDPFERGVLYASDSGRLARGVMDRS